MSGVPIFFVCMYLTLIWILLGSTSIYEFYGYAILKKYLAFYEKNINGWNVPLFINAIWLIRHENKCSELFLFSFF